MSKKFQDWCHKRFISNLNYIKLIPVEYITVIHDLQICPRDQRPEPSLEESNATKSKESKMVKVMLIAFFNAVESQAATPGAQWRKCSMGAFKFSSGLIGVLPRVTTTSDLWLQQRTLLQSHHQHYHHPFTIARMYSNAFFQATQHPSSASVSLMMCPNPPYKKDCYIRLYSSKPPTVPSSSLGGTTLSINYLKKRGYIKPVPSSEKLKEMYEGKKEELIERKEELVERYQERREEIVDKYQERKEEILDRYQEKREEMKERYQETKEEMVQRLSEKRNELKERVVEKTEEFKDRLEERKDQLSKMGENKKKSCGCEGSSLDKNGLQGEK
ncbi:uncharacterized protein E2C01_028982 [Portunus trituberculatus]|uniref:Uncharacterized protein n=1 Tax=Portunus trituberculatus TaxID=210409 RepID=A0A5B7EQM0_PORTR|nr:uncharacterized protein [Portunus trituberculatus]